MKGPIPIFLTLAISLVSSVIGSHSPISTLREDYYNSITTSFARATVLSVIDTCTTRTCRRAHSKGVFVIIRVEQEFKGCSTSEYRLVRTARRACTSSLELGESYAFPLNDDPLPRITCQVSLYHHIMQLNWFSNEKLTIHRNIPVYSFVELVNE